MKENRAERPPPWKRPWEDCEFSLMMPNINLLYLFTSVLVLLDRQYTGRFCDDHRSALEAQ